ncbi:MAG: riboflavin kinase, partial [Caulobacterales bacterium]
AQQSDREFCQDWVSRRLGATALAVGFDFSFGKGRAGTIDSLRALGVEFAFELLVMPEIEDVKGEKVSSSHIREALKAGDVKLAAAMLGRPWEIEAIVEGGEQRGRTIGYPTANMHLGPLLHPRHGIYAVRCAAEDGIWRDGVANFGRTPTTGLRDPLLEVHIFDFKGDLYGQTMRTQMIEFLRPEEKFDSLEALVAQMDRDSENARAILNQL